MQHITSQNTTPHPVTQPMMSHNYRPPQHVMKPSFEPAFNQLNLGQNNIPNLAYQNSGFTGPGSMAMPPTAAFDARKVSNAEATNRYDPARFESPSMPTNTRFANYGDFSNIFSRR